jgi:hypothetical protein
VVERRRRVLGVRQSILGIVVLVPMAKHAPVAEVGIVKVFLLHCWFYKLQLITHETLTHFDFLFSDNVKMQ